MGFLPNRLLGFATVGILPPFLHFHYSHQKDEQGKAWKPPKRMFRKQESLGIRALLLD
jgi:hypothetical protein